MRSVALAEAQTNLAELITAAEAGEDIVITRHGKPAVRLVPAVEDRAARQRTAVDALFELGRARRAAGRPITTMAEIIEWKNEDRR